MQTVRLGTILCQFCKSENREVAATVDGKTVYGFWAYMCDVHYAKYGVGMGIGRGTVVNGEKHKRASRVPGQKVPTRKVRAVRKRDEKA